MKLTFVYILKLCSHYYYVANMGFRCITKWNFAILILGMRAMETGLYTKYTKIWSGPRLLSCAFLYQFLPVVIPSIFLTKIYDSKDDQIFPGTLKNADVIHIHKKEERTSKENYRSVSLISKLFERDIYNQILGYIEKYLSPYLFGFRKGHSTERCLNVMIERWKKALDEKNMWEQY